MDDGTRQLQTFIFNAMPGTEGGGFAGSINGGQSYSHEILIDGISIGRMDLNGGSNSEFTPTIDAVSEFKLQTGALSSQYGNTQTAMTNFGMKSGTNAYHGSSLLVPQRTFPQRQLLVQQRPECRQERRQGEQLRRHGRRADLEGSHLLLLLDGV